MCVVWCGVRVARVQCILPTRASSALLAPHLFYTYKLSSFIAPLPCFFMLQPTPLLSCLVAAPLHSPLAAHSSLYSPLIVPRSPSPPPLTAHPSPLQPPNPSLPPPYLQPVPLPSRLIPACLLLCQVVLQAGVVGLQGKGKGGILSLDIQAKRGHWDKTAEQRKRGHIIVSAVGITRVQRLRG